MKRIVPVLVLFILTAGCMTGRSAVAPEKQASSHYKMGISFLNENALQEAYIEFQKALELTPKNKDIHYAIGHVHFVQSRQKEAEASFRSALKLDPNFSEAHNYLGKVLESQGKQDEAIAEYKEALKNTFYETPQIPHFNLGHIYMGREQYPEALREFQEALRLDPSCNESTCILAHNGLGQTYFQMGRIKEAIASYQDAIKAFPSYLDARYNLAFAYLKQGAKDKAAGEFRKVIELSPESDKAVESRKLLEALK
jgi:Tfp pilus assembly protein PilF